MMKRGKLCLPATANISYFGRALPLFRYGAQKAQYRDFSTEASSAPASEQGRNIFTQAVYHGDNYLVRTPEPHFQRIRHKLRIWELENQNSVDPAPQMPILERQKHGGINNSLARQLDSDVFEPEFYNDGVGDNGSEVSKSDLVDFGIKRTFLVPGDMVEFRSSNGLRTELAIFVRQLQRQGQFYTMSGKWMHQSPQSLKFFVPNFISPAEVGKLIPFLPTEEVPEVLQNKLQSFEHALPRNFGAPIIRKMQEFWNKSDNAYRASAAKLDTAHELVADQTKMRYASLHDLANELLPEMRNSDGEFESALIYAVHRCLMQDDLGFRAQSSGNHRVWGKFEISSRSQVNTVVQVTDIVRKYQEACVAGAKKTPSTQCTTFLSFIRKAKAVIKESRATRAFGPHGTLAPMTAKHTAKMEPIHIQKKPEVAFDEGDKKFLDFMKLWSGLRLFNQSSHYNGIGSAILRAMEMYEEIDLDQSTGWTFLQEVRAIAPWTNRAFFDLRLPIPGSEDAIEPYIGGKELATDTMQSIRKDWGNTSVYCIDDPSASEIDDGISLELTETPGQYWVHVHTADPASRIRPDSPMAQKAAIMSQNIYFPEQVVSMLPVDIVQDCFSLAPNRPCLTFSARMDEGGDLLDHKISAGIIHNVSYIAPEVANEVSGRKPSRQRARTLVGEMDHTKASSRRMKSAKDLSHEDKENLRILSRLSRAHHHLSSSRGAISFRNNQILTKVQLKQTPPSASAHVSASKSLSGVDPAIQLEFDILDENETEVDVSLVGEMMLTAGHVAARWCHERNIPTIYRVSQYNPLEEDHRIFYKQNILPFVEAGKLVPTSLLRSYLNQLGPVLPATTPGPHVAIGLDMYSKVTSPLRRYGDLVSHWQIEAALLEETQNINASSNDLFDRLPFSTDRINGLIPWLDTRERLLKAAQKASEKAWTLQALIRAWKFKQAFLPATFAMVVLSTRQHTATGEIPSLGGLEASFDIPTWIGVENLPSGSMVEVEIADINTYYRTMTMKPLRLL